MKNTLPVTDIRRSSGAEALELAWTLVENEHAINETIRQAGVIFEFPQWMAAEEFSTAVIDYINRCTDHSATHAEECIDKSYEWAPTSPWPGMPTPVDIYLPTIEIAFEDGLQVEGLVVTDKNGKPVGIKVTDCDEDKLDELLGTFIRI